MDNLASSWQNSQSFKKHGSCQIFVEFHWSFLCASCSLYIFSQSCLRFFICACYQKWRLDVLESEQHALISTEVLILQLKESKFLRLAKQLSSLAFSQCPAFTIHHPSTGTQLWWQYLLWWILLRVKCNLTHTHVRSTNLTAVTIKTYWRYRLLE